MEFPRISPPGFSQEQKKPSWCKKNPQLKTKGGATSRGRKFGISNFWGRCLRDFVLKIKGYESNIRKISWCWKQPPRVLFFFDTLKAVWSVFSECLLLSQQKIIKDISKNREFFFLNPSSWNTGGWEKNRLQDFGEHVGVGRIYPPLRIPVANKGLGWDSRSLKYWYHPSGDWHPGWGVDWR